ncbi:hypothetical protein CHS0354_011699 [Potamilus streckersoni]|uniref:Protein kinase domain-containing protein n=1 Tax=Potamilus streckersoni TaxID=2493646 RepID=A0AAE0VXK3_9BIVA|nr:hypothetical protein CHS0354_011699 [Potamilus streckersoni]
MTYMGAFTSPIRSRNEHLKVHPPTIHIAGCVTGGLKRLYQQIQSNIVPRLYDHGYYTAENGHFQPKGKCVVASRYMVTRVLLAKGQSAVLVMAEDLFNNNKRVIIKVLHVQFYEVGLQESHCLLGLRVADPYNYSHTLRLLATFTFDGHYCMVFEPLLPDPLTCIFREIPQHYLLSSIRKIALRLLASVGFLHQQNIIHADLKPENILLKDKSDLDSVHIVDFGNALNYVHREVSVYYNDFELQTPLYRAPEVMFGLPFGTEIDMWSIGCILAELYMGKPLFHGKRKEEILQQMTQLLGPLPSYIFQRGKFFPKFKQYTGLSNQCQVEDILRNYLHCRDFGFVSFLAGLLHYDPDVRLTVSEAARHPFLAGEFPVAYMFPQSHDKSAGYSAILLNTVIYQSSPVVSPDIQKRQPSSIELLRLGTSSCHDPPRMAVVDPIQKLTSHEKDRLARLNSFESSQDQGLRNLSQSSKCDMISSVRSSSHNLERKDIGNSTCQEKAVVEDLRWSTEQQHTVHSRESVYEGSQLNQIIKGEQLCLERHSHNNMDKNSVFRENVIIRPVPNDGLDRPKNREDVCVLKEKKPFNYRLGCEMDTAASRDVNSEGEYEMEEIISGNVDINRKSLSKRTVSKTGRKQRRPVSYICKSESWVPNHSSLNPNQNSEDKVILQRHNQRIMVPVSQDLCVSAKLESNATVKPENIEDRRDKLINAEKPQVRIHSPRYGTNNHTITGNDRKSLCNLQNINPSVHPLDMHIMHKQCKIVGPADETFVLKEKVIPCKNKPRKVTPSKQDIFHSRSKQGNLKDTSDKFSNNCRYKEIRSRVDNELEEFEILSPKQSLRHVSTHKELVLKRSHQCDEDIHLISKKRSKIEDKSRALKQSIKQNISSSSSSSSLFSSSYNDKEKLERRATCASAEVPPNLHKFDCPSSSVKSYDFKQILNEDKNLAVNDSNPDSVLDDTTNHKLDSCSKNFSGTMSFGEEKFEGSSLQYCKDNKIHLNSKRLERSFITVDSRNASLSEAEFPKKIRTNSSDRKSLEESHANEKICACNCDASFLRSSQKYWSCQEMEQQPTCKRSSVNEQTPNSCIHGQERAMLDNIDKYSDESFIDSRHSADVYSEAAVKDKCNHKDCSSSSNHDESLKTSEVKLNSNKTETVIQRHSFEKDFETVFQKNSFEKNSDINEFSPTGSKNLLQQGKSKKNITDAKVQIQVQRRKAETKSSVIHDPYHFQGSEEKIRGKFITDQQNSERFGEFARSRTWSEKGSAHMTFTYVNDCEKSSSRRSKKRLTYDNNNPLKSAGLSNTSQKIRGKKHTSEKKNTLDRTFSVDIDIKNDNSNSIKFCSKSLKWNHSKKKFCPRDKNSDKIRSSIGNDRRKSTESNIKFTEGYRNSTFIHQDSEQERQSEFSSSVKVRRSLDEANIFISQRPLEMNTDLHLIPSDDELEIQSKCYGQSGFSVHRNSINQEEAYSGRLENQSTQSLKSEFRKEVGNVTLLNKQYDSVGTPVLHIQRFGTQSTDISAEEEDEEVMLL